MEPEFWQERWRSDEIGFHLPVAHPLLKKYLPSLELEVGAPIFLPLCGKTLDIEYLLSAEYSVIGVELSEKAVHELFSSLNIQPVISSWRGGNVFRADRITIFQGNFFQLEAADIGAIHAVYDRAALVALPAKLRRRYAEHLLHISYAAQQLLISFEYSQVQMDGPPFSVLTAEVAQLYADFFELREMHRADILDKTPRFRERGLTHCDEVAWHLVPSSGRPD